MQNLTQPILLSDALSYLQCPSARPNRLDPAWELGCRMTGGWEPAEDAAEEADLRRQATAIAAMKGFLKPYAPGPEYQNPNLINDLFIAGWTMDQDGIVHVHFPVPTWLPLSSTLLGVDWRFIGLADVALAGMQTPRSSPWQQAVLTCWDATGRKVQAMVPRERIQAFSPGHPSHAARPCSLCARCEHNGSCPALRAYLEGTGLNAPYQPGPGADKDEVTNTRLFFERVDVTGRMDGLEATRKNLDREIMKRTSNDELRMAGEPLRLPRRKSYTYDVGRVWDILAEAGLWPGAYFTVKNTLLQEKLPTMPPDVKTKLEAARTETTTEMSIGEAIAHAKAAGVKPTFSMRGTA